MVHAISNHVLLQLSQTHMQIQARTLPDSASIVTPMDLRLPHKCDFAVPMVLRCPDASSPPWTRRVIVLPTVVRRHRPDGSWISLPVCRHRPDGSSLALTPSCGLCLVCKDSLTRWFFACVDTVEVSLSASGLMVLETVVWALLVCEDCLNGPLAGSRRLSVVRLKDERFVEVRGGVQGLSEWTRWFFACVDTVEVQDDFSLWLGLR
jgi:hypothetical protein